MESCNPGLPQQGKSWLGKLGVGVGDVSWGRRLVLGPGCALPCCGSLDPAFSFLSLKVLSTPPPGPSDLNNHQESAQAVRGMQVTPPPTPPTLSPLLRWQGNSTKKQGSLGLLHL